MICQTLFSGKSKKNISLSSAELAQKVVKEKVSVYLMQIQFVKCFCSVYYR